MKKFIIFALCAMVGCQAMQPNEEPRQKPSKKDFAAALSGISSQIKESRPAQAAQASSSSAATASNSTPQASVRPEQASAGTTLSSYSSNNALQFALQGIRGIHERNAAARKTRGPVSTVASTTQQPVVQPTATTTNTAQTNPLVLPNTVTELGAQNASQISQEALQRHRMLLVKFQHQQGLRAEQEQLRQRLLPAAMNPNQTTSQMQQMGQPQQTIASTQAAQAQQQLTVGKQSADAAPALAKAPNNIIELIISLLGSIPRELMRGKVLYFKDTLLQYYHIIKNNPQYFTAGMLVRPAELSTTYDQFIKMVTLIANTPDQHFSNVYANQQFLQLLEEIPYGESRKIGTHLTQLHNFWETRRISWVPTKESLEVSSTSSKPLSELVYDILVQQPTSGHIQIKMGLILLAMHVNLIKNRPELFTAGEFVIPAQLQPLYDLLGKASVAAANRNISYTGWLNFMTIEFNKLQLAQEIKDVIAPHIVAIQNHLKKISQLIADDQEVIAINPGQQASSSSQAPQALTSSQPIQIDSDDDVEPAAKRARN